MLLYAADQAAPCYRRSDLTWRTADQESFSPSFRPSNVHDEPDRETHRTYTLHRELRNVYLLFHVIINHKNLVILSISRAGTLRGSGIENNIVATWGFVNSDC